jgi:hypothetical protein
MASTSASATVAAAAPMVCVVPVGQVQPPGAQHLLAAQHVAHLLRRGDKGELEHAPLGPNAALQELALDGVELAEVLHHGRAGDIPTEALSRIHQTLVAEQFQRSPHGDPADGEFGREVALARQQLTAVHLSDSVA